ncbi:uncharacterized protein F4817DRAFT_264256 [Daldinia loculata]|uniref:uncharacterized protein n=1 Tax=Daldinia loculata TaxID=103429 RepID=UPI0020C1E2E6|nr:uncharacterized protein F4817DRAFT_264256 [Daldinia loculata]KAI1650552.1 hypothetical protein F4817DRAFT_264256 [Daldinia loculata]
MLNSTTSPSDFIYRRAQGSLVASPTREDLAMEPSPRTKVTGTKSLPVTAAEWEVVDPQFLPLSPGECPCFTPHPDLRYLKRENGHQQPPYDNNHPPLEQIEAPNNRAPLAYPQESAPRIFKPEPDAYSPQATDQHPWLSPPSEQNPDFPLPPAPAPSRTDGRTLSIATSSRTVSIPSSSTGPIMNICATARAVHDICLQATRTYLDTHIANRRARAASQGWSMACHGSGSGSSSNGASTNNSSNTANSSNNNNNNAYTHDSASSSNAIPPSTQSLLLNTSSICSMLWTGSQRDRLHVLNVERLAIESMGRLMHWAETVALSSEDEWRVADDQALWQVLDAGRNLCSWLGVPDAVHAMEALEGEVLGEYGGS